jgi:hypothetical protein
MNMLEQHPLAPLSAALVVGLLLSTWLAPGLIHALDDGNERVEVSRLAAGYLPKTRALTVEGDPQMELGVTSDTRKKEEGASGRGRSVDVAFYVPIVPKGWQPGQPVKVILRTHYYGLGELKESTSHRGLLRNVLWEGLDGQVRTYFVQKVGLKLDERVLLLDAKDEGYTAMPYLLLILLGMLVTFLLVRSVLKERAASPP